MSEAHLFDTRCLDLAESLLGGVEGATRSDIYALASDFQDAFERAADEAEAAFEGEHDAL